MPTRSKIAVVFVTLIFAFVWGYKRDAILEAFASWKATEEAPPAADPSVPPPPTVPVQTAVVQPPAPPFPGAPAAPPGFPQAPPPARQNTLSNTLDSIRPGQVQQEQLTQRNAYFEKLSQQLRDLQGGTPPPPGGPVPEAPPVAPPEMAPNVPPPLPPGVPQGELDQQTMEDDDLEEPEEVDEPEMNDEGEEPEVME